MSNHPKAKIETEIGNRLTRDEIESRVRAFQLEALEAGNADVANKLQKVLELFAIGEDLREPYIFDGWSLDE